MAAEAKVPFPNFYTKTQRIVFLIDLNPLLHLQDPNPYLKSLVSSSKTLLSFPPLSSSLFSFKPFFSSLSPFLSSSKLPFPSLSLSFNSSDSTFNSLTDFLTSIATTIDRSSFPLCTSRASNIAASLRQLVHDYAWDPLISDPVAGALFESDESLLIRSNLVVLLSPVYRELNWLREFFDVGMGTECLNDLGGFVKEFCGVFESVNDAFVSRDIHCCWVDLKFQPLEDGDLENSGFGFLESGIRSLGWGFLSSDSIVLGSAVVPFGLIYPNIAFSASIFHVDASGRRNAQLSLEILDANGKPLECKCCELEFVDFETCLSNEQMRADNHRNSSLLDQYLDGVTKVHVRALRRYDECEKLEGRLLNPIIVCEYLGKSRKYRKDDLGEFCADRVLQILARDMGESLVRKPVGIWQIFLSFLYREGYWALVSLSDGDSGLQAGILKPFTVFSAMLCIIGDEFCPNKKFVEYGKVDLAAYVAKGDDKTSKLHVDSNNALRLLDYRFQSSPSHKFSAKRKKDKRKLPLPHDLTWSAFCEAAAEHLEMDLEASYFSRNRNSKKLKFLKCWMKQVQKRSPMSFEITESAIPVQDATEEINHRPMELPQDSEQLESYSASAGEGFSRELDEAGNDFCSGSSENFFSSLPDKIKQGLESAEVELGAFAERLIQSSIYWLCQKHETEMVSESQTSPVKTSDACASKAVVELIKLLLREPKDLVAMHKRKDPSSQASDSKSTGSASILFRMEILQSEVGAILQEPMKQKFVKQICSLLESIQCHLEGGFFGDWRLDKYVEKIIKSRYYLSVGDVVDRIYTKMDLLLFDDGDELPNHVQNSKDSNRSWKEKPEEDVHSRSYEPVSIEEECPQLQKHDKKRSPLVMRTEEHELKLIQAQERRERARRFSSFTSWMPDLQRVWAPKQPNTMKRKSDNLRKLSKRKNCSKASYDTVCETPMTEKKRSSPNRNAIDDEEDNRDSRPHPHGPVSKALFQNDM
ncbi:LIM domain-containing protein A, putative isoform 2 [Hibiscus syriacus]|uniref:LIM domain-containing protein A, putative isoform 2 n=1 Tax=Hibiscus syriacus TaxID=106335 RepID=A0A6A3BQ14_HIBSY|nr:LIM domain-containing protein A, putative isoform 2 [Hibiscus syriacus]